MTFATLAALKQFLRIPTADTDDDVVLTLALDAATSAIIRASYRTFETAGAATERAFTAERRYESMGFIGLNLNHSAYFPNRVVITIDDTFAAAGAVTLKYASDFEGTFDTAVTGFRMFPFNAATKGRPYTALVLDRGTYIPLTQGSIGVTAAWGWAAVPSTIQSACLIQAGRYFKRRDALFGIAGSPDMGSELRLLSKLDPDVAIMVGDFKRWYV